MEIILKASQNSRFDAVGALMFGGLWIGLSISGYHYSPIFFSTVIVIAFRLYIYQTLDLWVNKKILVNDGNVILVCWGIQFNLYCDRSFLIIDEIELMAPDYVKVLTLKIQRNSPYRLGRLFKNNIKINSFTRKELDKIIRQASLLSNEIGIPFRDVYVDEY